MRGLTTKQKLFVEAYLANPNATDAARKAKYKGNDKTLSVVGAENLAKPCIAAMITKRVESFGKTADDVLRELGTMAFGSHKDYRSDKVKSLELIGKHFKLFTDKVEHGGETTQKVVVEFTRNDGHAISNTDQG